MADARYVVDIILNARDNTSEAFNNLLENSRKLKDLQKQQQDENERAGESFARMTQKINASQAELARQQGKLNAGSAEQVSAMAKLERAATAYARAAGDASQSDAARADALQKVVDAENDLVTAMGKGDAASKRRTARAVTDAATQVEALKQVRAEADRNAREDAKRDQEEARRTAENARSRANLLRTLDGVENDIARGRKERALEDQRDIDALEKKEADRVKKKIDLNKILDNSEREAAQRRIRNAEAENREVQKLEASRKRAATEKEREQQKELQAGRKYLEQLQKIAQLEKQRRDAQKAGDETTVQRIELDDRQARQDAAKLATEIEGILGRIEAGVDLDTGAAKAHAAELKTILDVVLRDKTINVDVDVDRAIGQMRRADTETRNTSSAFGLLRGAVASVGEQFQKSSGAVAGFDNYLRGLASLGVAVFLNQIVLLAGAAASAFMSLASSAAFAGAAIGGSIVAGVAQALGPLGILIATMQRVGAVTDAVKQANLLQQQQSYQGAEAAKQQATANDRVVGAQERVADSGRRVAEAQRGLQEAQKGVNEARVEAARALEDLILAERGLNLSMAENEEAIRKAQAAGQTEALPRLFLRRDELKQDLGRTQEEVGERQAGRAPEVEQAQKGVRGATEALKDAQRAAKDASRDVKRAQADAATAGAGVTAAAGKLNYLLGQLSGAERKLFDAIKRLQDVWREFSQEVTEPLILAFASAIDRIIVLLKDPRIVGAARAMSEEMAKQFTRIFKAFTSEESIQQLLRIMRQARTNLAPLADIAINIGKAFLDIAEAAGPALRLIILWVRDITDDVAKFFRTGRESGDLDKFFREGVKHLKAWGDLLWAVLRLFGAIAGPGGGAKSGLKLVQDLGKTIAGWADQIEKPGTKLNEFFRRFFRLGRQMLDVFGPVFEVIAEEFDKLFTGEGLKAVEGFAAFMTDILVPAFFDFLQMVGKATGAIGDFIKEHPELSKIASAVLAGVAAFSLLAKAASIFAPILAPFKFLIKNFDDVKKVLGAIVPGFSRLAGLFARIGPLLVRIAGVATGPFGLIAGVVILLLQRAGKLDDIWRKLIETGKEIWREIQPGFEDLKESVETLLDVFSKGGGLIDVFTAIASVIGDVLLEGINSLGILLQNVARGAMRVFGGLIDIVSAIMSLFRGDFDKAWELAKRGITKIVKGIWDIIWGVLSGLGGFFWRLFKKAIEALWPEVPLLFAKLGLDLIEAIWNIVKKLPGLWWDLAKDVVKLYARGFRGLVRVIRNVLSDVWDFVKSLPRRYWELAKDIVALYGRGFRRIVSVIRNAIEDAWDFLKKLPGRFWELAKDAAARWWDGMKNIGKSIKNAIEDVWGWIKGLPDRLWEIAKSAAGKFVSAFKNVGKDILSGIVGGLKDLAGFGKDIVNAFIDLFNTIIPNKLGPIPIPDNPIKRFASGGALDGYGGGDRIRALLEPGEHVLTKEEVRAAGGHAIIFALRAMLGGGGQGGPFGFQPGGAVRRTPQSFGPGAGLPSVQEKSPKEVDHEREEYKKSGQQRARDWRLMWNDMLTTTRRSTNDIEKQIRDMRVNTTATLRRMRRDTEKILDDMTKSFRQHGTGYAKSWARTMSSLKQVTYDGLKYIGHETNKALKALDIDHINFGLTAPTKSDSGTGSDPGNTTGGGLPTAAHGGIIGARGERGRDRVATLLGRGEAVLNYAHQAYVEPALQAFYGHGLGETFRRVRGYHAGGHGAPGFAAGGPTIDLMGSKPGFAMLMKFFRRRFRDPDLAVMSGFRGGAVVKGTSRTSNHASGDAIDITNPESRGHSASNPPPTSSLDRLFPFLLRWPQPPRRDTLWRTEEGGNHYDHVHLGMDPSVTGSIAKARAFLKDIPGGDFVSEVKRQIVKGIGPLREMVQKILDKVRKAANDKIDEEFGAVDATDGGHVEIGPGGPAEKIFNFFTGHGLSDAIAAGFVGVFKKESQFSTSVTNARGSGATGLAQWLGGRLTNLKAFAESQGAPWDSLQTQLDFVWHELKGDEAAAFAAILRAKSPAEAARIIDSQYERSDNILDAPAQAEKAFDVFAPGGGYAQGGYAGEYARGGQLPGPEGRPIPIVAHAGEWILNKGQQSRVADFLGTSVGRLRDALGFTGGPTSFQGGGEPKKKDDFVSAAEARLKALREGRYKGGLIQAIDVEDIGREIGIFTRTLGQVLDDITLNIREGIKGVNEKGKKIDPKKQRTALIKSIGLFADEMTKLGGENGLIARMTTSLEELGADMQRSTDLARVGLRRVAVTGRVRLRAGRRGVEKFDAGTKLVSRTPLVEGVDDVALATRAINMYDRLYEGIPKQRARAQRTISNINRALRRLRRGDEDKDQEKAIDKLIEDRQKAQGRLDEAMGLRLLRGTTRTALAHVNRQIARLGTPTNKKQEDLLTRLITQRNNFQKTLDDTDQKLLENRQAREEERLNRFRAQTERALRPTTRRAAQLERYAGIRAASRTIAETLGQTDTVAALDAQAVQNLRNQEENIRQQRAVVARRLAIARSKPKRNAALIAELEEQSRSLDVALADAGAAIIQAIAAMQAAAVEAINTRFGREQAYRGFNERISAAMGRSEDIPGLMQRNIELMNAQIGELAAQLPGLAATGNVGLYNAVYDQIVELQVSIKETTVGIFQNAIEQFDKATQRTSFLTELAGRGIDLRERAGDRLGAARDRMGQSDRRVLNLQAERMGVQRFLAEAQAMGLGADKLNELTDRIAELDAQIAEENQTRKELVFQYRSLVTEIIAGRAERATGLVGTASGIIQQVGNLAGVVNQPAIVALLRQTRDVLRTGAQEILRNVAEAQAEFGRTPGAGGILSQLAAAFSAGPQSFATSLAQLGPAIAALEATMTDVERSAFQALIDSMINNTTATLDNNIALRDATGAITQSFTSAPWQLFRQAIFSGSGNLLPQYNFAQMHNGGIVGTSGLYRLAAGERVLSVQDNRRTGTGDETHVHLHNVTQEVDVGHVFEVAEWKRSHRRAT